MTKKRSNKEIWDWYKHVEKQIELHMTPKEYSNKHDIDYRKFTSMLYRIQWKSLSQPDFYAEIVSLTRKYLRGSLTADKFCKEHKITRNILSECTTHLKYLDAIENIRRINEPNSMNFIQLASQVPSTEIVSQGEIVEKQNDLEIIIAKGVKVSISPNIDSMKIIKIIELLKDL